MALAAAAMRRCSPVDYYAEVILFTTATFMVVRGTAVMLH